MRKVDWCGSTPCCDAFKLAEEMTTFNVFYLILVTLKIGMTQLAIRLKEGTINIPC